jgi:hypothetical protein
LGRTGTWNGVVERDPEGGIVARSSHPRFPEIGASDSARTDDAKQCFLDCIDALKFMKVCELGAVDNSTTVMDEEPDMSALR